MRTVLGVLLGAAGLAAVVGSVYLWINVSPFLGIPVGGLGAATIWAVIDNGFIYKRSDASQP